MNKPTSLSTSLPPIVIEGPDGSGKTTLIEQSFPNAIHGGGPPHNYGEFLQRLRSLERGKVYDRWMGISELVYGPIVRGSIIGGMEGHRQILSAIELCAPIVIYCRPPDDVLEENMRTQQVKAHKSLNHIQRIQMQRYEIREAYDELMRDIERLGANVYHYDYTAEKRPASH